MQEKEKTQYKKVRKEDMDISGVPMGVKVVSNQIEPAIRLWKMKVKNSGKIDELKERREYIKPSVEKRKNKERAERTEWVRRQREN
jgi:ribosomal protein S21